MEWSSARGVSVWACFTWVFSSMVSRTASVKCGYQTLDSWQLVIFRNHPKSDKEHRKHTSNAEWSALCDWYEYLRRSVSDVQNVYWNASSPPCSCLGVVCTQLQFLTIWQYYKYVCVQENWAMLDGQTCTYCWGMKYMVINLFRWRYLICTVHILRDRHMFMICYQSKYIQVFQ